MFISTKANHSLNSSNPAHGLKQQNLPGLLIAALTTPALANTKSTTENLNFTEDSSTLLPSIPPAQLFNDVYNNESAIEGESGYVVTPRISSEIPIWLIPCYGVIFFFAIVGNLLVISTLVQNRRMRTITNVFLLNLAISDMLLGVLCMPVTLVGTLLRHFIFGEFFCKLIQFSQAASVAVSSWTLVAISCERYYAICHPLRSRTWQTINHAYRIIGFIWFGSIICMTPIAIFSQLIPTSRQGLRKCREQWPEDTIAYERSYNIFLDLALLVLPLFILCVAYILITRTLYVGMRAERALIFGGYATSNTPVKQHVGTSLPAISTVTGANAATATTTLPPSVLRSFNLKMSLRCHRKPASVGSCAIRSDDQDIVSEMQSDMGYHQHRHHQHEQQQRQQEQQLKYYDDSGGGGDVLHKSFSIASTKTPQSLFGLRVLPCVDKVEQQKEMQPPTPPQQQQQLLLLQNNIARHLHGYNSNGNHTANNSEGTILFANHHQPHQQNLVTLRANLPQYHSNQLNQQQQKQNLLSQVSLQSQQKHLIGDRRKTYSTPSIRIKESTLRRSNETKNLESKKRVVKMLFVLVLEFFICWTPLYVINTVAMFSGPAIYEYIDYTSICFFQLLAYSSSCCNPITYCFMNASFRRAFLDTFKGLHLSGNSGGAGGASVGIWHSRQKGTDCGVGGGSRSDAHLPALVTNDSIALANNAIIASNNTSMHGSQHPQRN